MREILFRGKRVDNGEWVEGYYAKQSNHACFASELKYQHFIYKDVFLDFNLGGLQEFEIDPSTVCQYTGLTDKNGKKIFDGDILDTPYTGKIKVCFDDGVFGADCGDGYGVLPLRRSIFGEGGIVIGNIYDNPELLERSKDNG